MLLVDLKIVAKLWIEPGGLSLICDFAFTRAETRRVILLL
jgi:hypothetical protein